MNSNIIQIGPSVQPTTLPGLLSDALPGHESLFLLCSDRKWTYAEFSRTVDSLASGLLLLGIRRGDRVAIAAPNSAQWLLTWFAVTKIGAILVTLNVAYREREFRFMLNQSGAVMLISCARDGEFDFVDFLDELRPRIPTVSHYVFLGERGFEGSRRWDDLLVDDIDIQALTHAGSHVEEHDPAVILYTSGTTGDPKGATLTHASIIASARAQAAHLDQTSDDVAIGHMPLNHVGGMTCTVAAAMSVRGKVALLPRYSPTVALQAIERHAVTIFIGVPTMYTLMLDLPEFTATDTSTIRTCIIGGSNVEPAMGRRILETFPGTRLANLYGLSETSGGCVISAADDELHTLVDTLGVGIGDFEVRVTDDEHNSLPPGSEGHLHIRGGCVASGYWENPVETDNAFLDDGWLVTGDIAVIRLDGRVAMRGRQKEMYVRSGYNVYPVEIENVLAADETVAMCAVVGVPDELLGEVGHAYVVPVPWSTVDVEKLLARCTEMLAGYKIPARIHVVQSLPLTPSGKIKKIALRSETAGTDG